MSALTVYWETFSVADTTVTTKILKTLDIQSDLTTKVTFDVVVLKGRTNLLNFFFSDVVALVLTTLSFLTSWIFFT